MKRAVVGTIVAVVLLGVAVTVNTLTSGGTGPRGPRGRTVHVVKPGRTVHTSPQPASTFVPQPALTAAPQPTSARHSSTPTHKPSHRPTHRPSHSPKPKPTCLLGLPCVLPSVGL